MAVDALTVSAKLNPVASSVHREPVFNPNMFAVEDATVLVAIDVFGAVLSTSNMRLVYFVTSALVITPPVDPSTLARH